MKVRLKFSKQSDLRFIGHLDLMRFFQKAIRRSDLPISFSEGFSPHMIMSFASPLGLGLTSEGEYVDLELTQELSSDEIVQRLNRCMVDGLYILDAVQIPEGRSQNAMALVTRADYRVRFREGYEPESDWLSTMPAFLAQNHIEISKETKKGQKIVDIRPQIYAMSAREDEKIVYMHLAAGSAANLKPELVMATWGEFADFDVSDFSLAIHRCEMYADDPTGEGVVPLQALGKHIPDVSVKRETASAKGAQERCAITSLISGIDAVETSDGVRVGEDSP